MAKVAALIIMVTLLTASAAANKDKDKDKHKGEAPTPSVSIPPPVEILPPPPPPPSPPVVQPPPDYYGPTPPDYYGPPPPVYTYASPPPPPPSPSPPPPPPSPSPPPPSDPRNYYSPPPPTPGCYGYPPPPPPPPPPSGFVPVRPSAADLVLLRQIDALQRLVLRLYWLALSGYPLCLQDDPFMRPLLLQFKTAAASSIRQTSSLLQLSPSGRSPKVDLSRSTLARLFNSAFGRPLKPQFDAYANSTNFILAAFAAGPSLVSSMSIDALLHLSSADARSLAARLVAAYSRQDAIIRFIVYQKQADVVVPYKHTVADFATRLCKLQNRAVSSRSEACNIGAAFDMRRPLSSANVTSYVTRFNLLP